MNLRINRSSVRAVILDYGRTLYDRDNGDFFPETRDILEYLYQKYKLAIVSIANENDPPEARLRALENAKIKKYFSAIYFHEQTKNQLFEQVLNEFRIRPEQAVLVDDRIKRGIAWGNKNGAITIWLRKGKFADELPDEETGAPVYTIESLSALKELL